MEFISVFGQFTGCFLPEWLLKRTEISIQAKVVYARLVYHGGKDGIAYPKQTTIARDTGLSTQRIKRSIKELKEHSLIHTEPRGGRSITYRFLPHEWMNKSTIGSLMIPNTVCKKCSIGSLVIPQVDHQRTLPKDILIEEERREEKLLSSLQLDESFLIFDHWKKIMAHPRAKLDDKRKRKIKAALKIGYSVGELKAAIEGCAKSSFHMGHNLEKKKYDGIELIMRDADHIESFIDCGAKNSAKREVPTEDPKAAIIKREGKIEKLRVKWKELSAKFPGFNPRNIKHNAEVGEIESMIEVLGEQIIYFKKRI